MTKEEKMQAYAMILDGATCSEIAKKFHVSRQRVYQLFTVRHINVEKAAEKVIYPKIAEWMLEKEAGFGVIASMIGGGLSHQTISYNLTTPGAIKKYLIDDICAITGLSYEEAFCEEK